MASSRRFYIAITLPRLPWPRLRDLCDAIAHAPTLFTLHSSLATLHSPPQTPWWHSPLLSISISDFKLLSHCIADRDDNVVALSCCLLAASRWLVLRVLLLLLHRLLLLLFLLLLLALLIVRQDRLASLSLASTCLVSAIFLCAVAVAVAGFISLPESSSLSISSYLLARSPIRLAG